MAIIYADTSDGVIYKLGESSYDNARQATTGVVNDSSSSIPYFVRADYLSGRRGGITWNVARSFYAFDVSGISNATSISLKIYGSSDDGEGDGIIVVRSDAFGGDGATALATGDFNAIHGWDGASTMVGQATPWSAAYNTSGWSTSGYNSIPLSAAFESVVNSNSYVLIAVVDYTYDYLKASPPSPNYIGGYYSDNTSASKDPYLDITLSSSDYGHDVITVAATSIGKVNAVATANIGKIITVD